VTYEYGNAFLIVAGPSHLLGRDSTPTTHVAMGRKVARQRPIAPDRRSLRSSCVVLAVICETTKRANQLRSRHDVRRIPCLGRS